MKKYLLKVLMLMSIIANVAAAHTAIVPDEKLVQTVLENGLTVVVYPNSEPPNRVSMRLLVKRGSLCETEDERGLAHFIEHMAFNGTKHFPSGDMVEYFQRLGMAFGADTNAHTGFTETVYKLDLPEVSDKLVGDGLQLLRDYADGILFDENAIESERGVIEAEKNSRDDQKYRKAVAEIDHFYKGTGYPKRMPIGELSVIRGAKRDAFIEFYRSAYRPENMVLVVAGSVEPKKIAALAEKYFADMRGSDVFKNRVEALDGLEKSAGDFSFSAENFSAECAGFELPNASSSSASLGVSHSIGGAGDSFERRVRDFRLRAVANALDARFTRASKMSGSKIRAGVADFFDFDRVAETFFLNAEAPVNESRAALSEIYRQLLSFENLADSEIENGKKKILADIDNAVKGKSTRRNMSLANLIVSSYSDGEIFTSPEFDLKIAQAAFADFDAAQAKKLLAEFFGGGKLKVFISDAKVPTGAALEKFSHEALAEAAKTKYAADTFAKAELAFAEFGKTGKITERKVAEDLGIVSVRFENNVRLNLKKTDFAKDQILFKITFGDGILSLPTPEYFAAAAGLSAGGTKLQSAAEIAAAQYSMKMEVNFSVDGNCFVLGGYSCAKDFESAVKYAATVVSNAGFRDDGTEIMLKNGEALYRSYDTEARAQLAFLPLRLTNSNFSSVPGKFENFKKITMADVAKWLKPQLEKSYMEISVVGDIDIQQTEKLFAETFGALASRADTKIGGAFADVALKPSGFGVDSEYSAAKEPLSIAARIWLSCGRTDIAKMRAANVLGEVFDDILRKEIRVKQGKTYSPFAYNNSSVWIKNVGFMTAMTAVAPEFNSEVGAALQKCGEIVMKGIDEDQFERAKIPLEKSVEANLRKNTYWLDAVLNLSQLNPILLDMARTVKSGYSQVTLLEVNALAREIFSKKPYEVKIMPSSDKAK